MYTMFDTPGTRTTLIISIRMNRVKNHESQGSNQHEPAFGSVLKHQQIVDRPVVQKHTVLRIYIFTNEVFTKF